MPNLDPPITTIKQARAYRQRILDAVPQGKTFTPYMTVYLTDDTDLEEIKRGFAGETPEEKVWVAAKLYPANATTNSEQGVTDIQKIYPVLEVMQEIGMPLLIHGEQPYYPNGNEVDIFDREWMFIKNIGKPTLEKFPKLLVVFEHVSTTEGIDFVLAQNNNRKRMAGTITPHHLVLTINDLFREGIRPDNYCMPIVKGASDRNFLRSVLHLPYFFAGTDSAPHNMGAKYCACGSAGIFNSPVALEVYTEVFRQQYPEKHQQEHQPEMLGDFVSKRGPKFYGIHPKAEQITLVKSPWTVPNRYGDVVPFMAGQDLSWKLVE